MSNIENRIAAVPVTNYQVWNQINAFVRGHPLPLSHKGALSLRTYNPTTDEWEHHDVERVHTTTLAEIIKWVPLGGDNFAEWLKTGKVSGCHYNHPSDPRYIAHYLEIDWLCRVLEVGNSLVYCESEDSWYWTIESSAQAERFIGKNYSLSSACECVLVHLFTIGKKLLCEKRGINPDAPDTASEGIAWTGKRLLSVNKGEKSIDFEKRGRVYFHGVSSAKLTTRDGKASMIELSIMPHTEAIVVRFMAIELGHRVGIVEFNLSEQQISWDVMDCVKGLQVEFIARISVER